MAGSYLLPYTTEAPPAKIVNDYTMYLFTITHINGAAGFRQLVLNRLCPLIENDLAREIDFRGLIAGSNGVLVNLQIFNSLSNQALAQKTPYLSPLFFVSTWTV